ncbi:MAG: hypothetical protein ACRDVE_18465 [Actinocrinis sp.]
MALVGSAAAGIMGMSTTTASAAAWTQTTWYFTYQASCVYKGKQDVAAGDALNYYCNYENLGNSFPGPGWAWHLYEFVD